MHANWLLFQQHYIQTMPGWFSGQWNYCRTFLADRRNIQLHLRVKSSAKPSTDFTWLTPYSRQVAIYRPPKFSVNFTGKLTQDNYSPQCFAWARLCSWERQQTQMEVVASATHCLCTLQRSSVVVPPCVELGHQLSVGKLAASPLFSALMPQDDHEHGWPTAHAICLLDVQQTDGLSGQVQWVAVHTLEWAFPKALGRRVLFAWHRRQLAFHKLSVMSRNWHHWTSGHHVTNLYPVHNQLPWTHYRASRFPHLESESHMKHPKTLHWMATWKQQIMENIDAFSQLQH